MVFDEYYTPRRGVTKPPVDQAIDERLAAQGEFQAAAIYAEFACLRKDLAEIKATLDQLKDKGKSDDG